MTGKYTFLALALAALAVLPAAVASNPQIHSIPLAQLPGTQPEKEFVNTAYYEENREINRIIDTADKLALEGEWQPAIMHYQKALEAVLDNCPDGLISVPDAVGPGLVYHKPYDDLIRQRLLAMAADEIAYYRAQYENTAAVALARARRSQDSAKLVDVAQRWPFTKSGQAATRAAAVVSFERGDYFTAARRYLDLAEIMRAWPPYKAQHYATVLAGAAAAYSAAGSRHGLDRIEALAKADPAILKAKIKIDGDSLVLGDHLATLSNTVKRPEPKKLQNWPVMGGDNTRCRVYPHEMGSTFTEMWRHEIEYPGKHLFGRAYKSKTAYAPILPTGIPVAVEGCVYANIPFGLVALDAFSGRKILEKRPEKAEHGDDFYREIRGKIDAATIHDGVAYAVFSTGARSYGTLSAYNRMLVAIDLETGKLLWEARRKTGVSEDRMVCGSPIIYGDSVVFQTESIEGINMAYYLVCADAKTGALRWRTNLAVLPFTISNMHISSYRQAASVVAVAGNTGIVQSGSATITNVDLDTGRIVWGIRYNRDFIDPTSGREIHRPFYAPNWCVNPPMVAGDRVIVKPNDSFRVMCLHIADGRLLWAKTDPKIAYIAGIDGESLFVVGGSIAEINIADGTEKFAKEYKVAGKSGQTEYVLGNLLGRPAVAKDAVYISTIRSLYRFDRAAHKLEKCFDWESREMLPGNLLITDDGFFVGNSEEVVAFFGPRALDIIDARLAKNPGDPALLIRRASALRGQGRPDEAVRDLETAAKKCDPKQQQAGVSMLSRINLLKGLCYSDLARTATDPQKAVQMAQLAVKFAVGRERIIETTCVLAEKQSALGDDKMSHAVEGLQKVIQQNSQEMLNFGNHFEQSSANYAAERLGEILRKHGRKGYAGVEAEAQKLYDAAKTAGARKDMLQVCKLYPNSFAGLAAIEWASDPKNGGRGPGFEAMALRAALHRFADTPKILPYLLRLQNIARDCGDWELESITLERLAKMPPAVKTGKTGAEVPVAQYARERLAAVKALVDRDDEQKPLPPDSKFLSQNSYYTKKFDRQARLNFLRPRGLRPAKMHDKILLTRGTVIECVDLKTGKRLWSGHPTRQWLGLSIDVDTQNRIMKVKEIYQGHRAARAGVRVGDIVLTINGVGMKSVPDFRKVLDAARKGDKMTLQLMRGGKRFTVVIIAEPIPASFTPNVSEAFYAGANRLVLVATYPNLELRCINIDDGSNIWERKGLPERNSNRNLPEPLEAYAGSMCANGLFSYFDPTGGLGALVTIDLRDGREIERLSVDKNKFFRFSLAAGMYLIQHDDTCIARDALTGDIRYKFKMAPLPPRRSSLTSNRHQIGTTADRTLVYSNYRHDVVAADLYTARELFVAPLEYNTKVRVVRSQRYIMVMSEYLSTYNRSRNCHLVDCIDFDILRNIDIVADIQKAVIDRRTIIFPSIYGSENLFASYDIAKGSLFVCKRKTAEQYKHATYTKPAGRYVVMVGTYDKPPAQPKPDAKGQKTLWAAALDAATGKEVCLYEKPIQYRTFVDAHVIDGRLCIIHGNTMMILGKQNAGQ